MAQDLSAVPVFDSQGPGLSERPGFSDHNRHTPPPVRRSGWAGCFHFQCALSAESWSKKTTTILPSSFEFLAEPGTGVGPQTAGRAWRDAQDVRHLGQRKSGEITQLHDIG